MNKIHHSVCPICENTNLKPFVQCVDRTVTQEIFQIEKCPNCQVAITQNMPNKDHIHQYYQSENYISHSDTKKGFINKVYHLARQKMLRNKLNLIKKETQKNKGKLADIGCGTGYFPDMMQRNGWETRNADADENARHFANHHFDLEVHTPEQLFSKTANNELDVVTMWHVLEHVHDLNHYLAEIYRMLRQDGRFVVAVPNYQSSDAQHYGAMWAGWDVPRHLWHFSVHSMHVLAQKHRFEIVKMKTMPFDPFYVSLLSEQYKGNPLAILAGFFQGTRSFLSATKNIQQSSSVIYVLKKES